MKARIGILMLWGSMAQAQFSFESASKETEFWRLLSRYRCVVCQNQSIADSDAKIAKSMRAFVYESWQHGESVDQIDQALVERYGDFVLDKPPIKWSTWLLWGLPAFVWLCIIRHWWGMVQRNADVDD